MKQLFDWATATRWAELKLFSKLGAEPPLDSPRSYLKIRLIPVDNKSTQVFQIQFENAVCVALVKTDELQFKSEPPCDIS